MIARWLICLCIVLASFPCYAQLSLLRRLGNLADAVSLGDALLDLQQSEDRFVTALRAYPDARAIIAAEAGIFLLDASGGKALVPVVSDEQGIRLTDEFTEFFRATDLLVAEEQVEYFKAVILQLDQMRKQSTRVVRPDGSVTWLHSVPGANGPDLVLEYTRDVYLQHDRNPDEVISLLKQAPRSPRLISLLDAADTELRQGLEQLPNIDHQVADQLQTSQIQQLISAQRGGTLFVIGHLERGVLLTRDAGASQRSVPLADLEAAARGADAMLIVLGCAARNCSSSGAQADPNLLTVPEAIGKVMEQASVGAVLASLARNTGGLLLKAGSTDELRASVLVESLPRLESLPNSGVLGAAQIWLPSVARYDELRLRVIPGIPSMIQLAYIACFIVMIISIKPMFQLWSVLLSPTPQLRSAPIAWCAAQLTRGIGLFALMPWVMSSSVGVPFAVWVWPLLFILIPQLLAWPAAIVGVYFGIHWYRAHVDEVGDEPWLRRFIAIPVFALALTVIIGLAAWPLRELIELYFAQSRDDLITRCVLNTLELAAAYAAGRWMLGWLQRRAWLPQVWLDYLLIGPLRLIESAAYLIWHRAV